MPTSVTLTIADADLPRLQAALTAAGISQPKQALVAYITAFVKSYETSQAQVASGASYAAGYTPIAPT
jgi:hypothetical protein